MRVPLQLTAARPYAAPMRASLHAAATALWLTSAAACSMFRDDNRRTLNLIDRELAPASTGAKIALAPVALPVGVTAFAADLVVVHPIASIDDAWLDTEELLWQPKDESGLRRALFVPLAAVATPFVFVGDWVGRWLLPITGRPEAGQ
jgi:hypothetical protein